MLNSESSPERSVRKVQPAAEIKTLVVICIGIALWNCLRLVTAVTSWSLLQEFDSRGGALFLALSGGIWAFTWMILGWSLWTRKAWGWGAALGGAIGYWLWLFLRLFFIRSGADNLWFSLAWSSLWLALLIWIISSRKVRMYIHDREQKTP